MGKIFAGTIVSLITVAAVFAIYGFGAYTVFAFVVWLAGATVFGFTATFMKVVLGAVAAAVSFVVFILATAILGYLSA